MINKTTDLKKTFTNKLIILSIAAFAGIVLLSSCGSGGPGTKGYNYANHNKRNGKHHKKHSKLPKSDTGIGFNNSSKHGH